MSTNTARLLQLCSQALPVGAYAYSSALEAAVASGQVEDATSAGDWIGAVFRHGFGQLDLTALLLAGQAMLDDDQERLRALNEFLRASRETSELLLEDVEMGKSLHRLLAHLGISQPEIDAPSFAIGFAAAGLHWRIEARELARGFCFSWLENQAGVAVKTVPLGQTEAQVMLGELIEQIDTVVEQSETLALQQHDGEFSFGESLPALALLSCWHEVQEARLYRS